MLVTLLIIHSLHLLGLVQCGSHIPKCLSKSATLAWNRTLNYQSSSFALRVAVTNDSTHWMSNYIFAILARERLGYQQIEFVPVSQRDTLYDSILQLQCKDEICKTLPNVHVNLLIWLPLGVDVNHGAPPFTVTDHGSLGPVRQWDLFIDSTPVPTASSNPEESCSKRFDTFLLLANQTNTNPYHCPANLQQIIIDDSAMEYRTSPWALPSCLKPTYSGTNEKRTIPVHVKPHQATKIAWTQLSRISQPLSTLTSRMLLTANDVNELLKRINASGKPTSNRVEENGYFDSACKWLRQHEDRWKWWTENWNLKLNLSIAGLFAYDSSSIPTNLNVAADRFVRTINRDQAYFLNSEYALSLDMYNVSCKSGHVLSDYFKILSNAKTDRLVGTIAAVCTDVLEAVVELGNLQKKLIVSPTVSSAEFSDGRYFPYFFRTSPSMAEANYVLLHLFRKWKWRRVVFFRKKDPVFNPHIFQAAKIHIIADSRHDEDTMTFKEAETTLQKLKAQNSRIFVIEFGSRATTILLCAAHHLEMFFSAGYVWFLNSWLWDDWWQLDNLNCTAEDITRMSSGAFSITHYWLASAMADSFNRLQKELLMLRSNQKNNQVPIPNSTTTDHHQPNSGPVLERASRQTRPKYVTDELGMHLPYTEPGSRSDYYMSFTEAAVISMSRALISLLKDDPAAISVLDDPRTTEALRHRMSRTKSTGSSEKAPEEDNFVFRGEFYTRQEVHFNSLNGRVVNEWVLKQRKRSVVIPIMIWSRNPNATENFYNASHVVNTDKKDGKTDTAIQDAILLAGFHNFEAQVNVVERDRVFWGPLGVPPHDGSIVAESCRLGFLSKTLGMGCTGAIVFLALLCAFFVLTPIILLGFHYRRKLKEAEQLTRKPFEELCAELIDLNMSIENIVLNRRIGQGAFGLVFGGEAKRDGRWAAVAVKASNEKCTYENKIDFLWEAKLMRSLAHPNVVRLIGISTAEKGTLYIIMELMLLGDLKTYLLSRRILAQRSPDHVDIRPQTLTSMSLDIAEGVRYLHCKQLIHRDIACRNCLVGSDHVVKLGDFGLTREAVKNKPDGYYKFTRNCELPLRWMSPEAVQYGIFSIQSDIWSYGITLYEIVTFGLFPYTTMGDIEVVERVKRMEFSIADFLPPAAVNSVVWNLIRSCCQHHWINRPSSMSDVIKILQEFPECVQPFLTDDPPKGIIPKDQPMFPGMTNVPETITVDHQCSTKSHNTYFLFKTGASYDGLYDGKNIVITV